MSMEVQATDTVSLAFLEPVVHRLDDPQAVFESADEWAFNIGILHDSKLLDVVNTRQEYGIETDFHNGPKPFGEALGDLHETLETSRHIVVGPDEEYADVVESNDWEYITLAEAADAADWELKPE